MTLKQFINNITECGQQKETEFKSFYLVAQAVLGKLIKCNK